MAFFFCCLCLRAAAAFAVFLRVSAFFFFLTLVAVFRKGSVTPPLCFLGCFGRVFFGRDRPFCWDGVFFAGCTGRARVAGMHVASSFPELNRLGALEGAELEAIGTS